MKTSLACALVFCCTLYGAAAEAQEAAPGVPAGATVQRGFAIDRFDPSERGSQWFSLDSLDFRGGARPAFGVVADLGHKPLVIYNNADGSENAVVVRDQLFVHVGGEITLASRLRVGVNVPLAVLNKGATAPSNGVYYRGPDGAGIGDLRGSAAFRLFGEFGDALTSALGVSVYVPTGSRENFTGDGSLRLKPHWLFAGDAGPLAYAASAGFMYRSLDQNYGGRALGSELTYGLALGVRAANRHLVVGPEVFGSTITDSLFKKNQTPLEGIFGAHYEAGPIRFGVGVGTGIARGFGAAAIRGLASLEIMPEVGNHDRDGDGIVDDEDACPDKPGVRTSDVKTNGCPPPPPPPPDRDSDGVPDYADACPDTAGARNFDPKKNGCPSDRDEDGVLDKVDICPDIPGEKSDDPKKNGCPPDKDDDGIFDKDDACPEVAGVRHEDPKRHGCPPDRDSDGILDKDDACPDQPGPNNADPKKNGCPAARIEAGQIKIMEQVKFKTNSADILAESDGILNAVLKVLTEHAEIKKLRVEGHTDSKGLAKANKTLSQKRAASVMKWLTSHGIETSRLEAQGFGADRPIDTNNTEDGRKNNRRVEFHIEAVP